jgi:hypothetical protein
VIIAFSLSKTKVQKGKNGRYGMRYSLFLMLLLFVVKSSSDFVDSKVQAKLPVRITGRVVDGKRNPVSGGEIIIDYSGCKECMDKILPAAEIFEDGNFGISLEGLPEKGLVLYATGPVPQGFWSIISVPSYNLKHNPVFRGHPLRFLPKDAGEWYKIGDVVATILYTGVKLDLVSLFPGKYEASERAAGYLKIALKDSYGKQIYKGDLPTVSAFDPGYSFANIALPQGRWSLTISFTDENQLSTSRRITLDNKSTNCKLVTFVGRQQKTSKCADP